MAESAELTAVAEPQGLVCMHRHIHATFHAVESSLRPAPHFSAAVLQGRVWPFRLVKGSLGLLLLAEGSTQDIVR
jgi:hypothetical protein